MNSERDLQQFIAENPWLLNPNYEAVPQMPNNGMEYQIGSQQRIDLILRDKVNKAPVVVEFKFQPMIRENIGQILEYRARIAGHFNKEETLLHEIFGDFLLAPKLVLVVQLCDNFFRVACNLAGIDIFEYKNISKVFTDPSRVKTVRAFTEALQSSKIPLTLDRGQKVEELVYRPIRTILEKYQIADGWIEPRASAGYFYPQFNSLYINRWLFKGEPVSIGLYEDFLSEKYAVCICFYGTNQAVFEAFGKSYQEKYANDAEFTWHAEWSEGYLRRWFDPNEFFQSADTLFEAELTRYLALRHSQAGT